MRPSTSLNKIVIFQSIVLVTLFQNVLGDLRFLEQFLRNIIYHEEAHKYREFCQLKQKKYRYID